MQQKIYTRSIYVKFQKELHNAGPYSVEELVKDVEYEVKREMEHADIEFYRKRLKIEVDRSSNTFNYICKKFSRDGVLCCHLLRLFTQLGVNEIPEQYIKKRWTKLYQENELKLQKQVVLNGSGTDND
jgi:hypothetical protein